MSLTVVVFLPDGRPLALGETEFRAALAAGEAFAVPAQPPLGGHASSKDEREWLDAETLAQKTGTDARFWRARARVGEVAHRKVGRRIFFPASLLSAEFNNLTGPTAPAAVAPITEKLCAAMEMQKRRKGPQPVGSQRDRRGFEPPVASKEGR